MAAGRTGEGREPGRTAPPGPPTIGPPVPGSVAAEASEQLSLVADLALQGNLFGAPEAAKATTRTARPGAQADPGDLGELGESGEFHELNDAALEADASSRPRRR